MKLNKTARVLSMFALLPVTVIAKTPTPVVVDGGTVNFDGSVVNAACAVAADSASLNVDMGQVRTTALSAAGSEAATGKAFSITLTDCDATTCTTWR